LPVYLLIEDENNNVEQTIGNLPTDFGYKIQKQLKTVLRDIEDKNIIPVEDEHARSGSRMSPYMRMRLGDSHTPSVFRFAKSRMICFNGTLSNVRKKNDSIRLCVDLQPLNSKVIKQKYPFPVIEECLARLGNNKVFTLLDLKDSFHQIKVHENSTKYFSFATPDGQFEFKRLPFGYCEAPAEFQKRLIQILNPFIREDKVIIYIDDVLIPSKTVEENLEILKEILLIFKKYDFALNISKCKFLRREIEFLGYIISENGLTLSSRHTEAVKNYKRPRDRVQLQRFLGLTNYFRRFIKDYACKVRPLQNPLKKDTEFEFDNCWRCSEQSIINL